MKTLQQNEAELRAMRRLRILQTMLANYPAPVTERALLSQLMQSDADLNFESVELRRVLDYLSELNPPMCKNQVQDNLWASKIMPAGIDYLDGLGPDLPGVKRPF